MYMVNHTSEEFRNKVAEGIDTVVIPVGSVEAHGNHLPLGTDIFSPELFCTNVEDFIGDAIWIAPGIPYGQSYDLSVYPGTIHIPSQVMAEYIFHIGKSLEQNGIKKIVFLNGHGGNINALNLACEKLVELKLCLLTINWWMDYSEDILKITTGQGHGGEDETSAILYYNSKLVKMAKATKNNKKPLMRAYYPDRGKVLYENALSGDATLASWEKGEQIFDVVTDKIVGTLKTFMKGEFYKACE